MCKAKEEFENTIYKMYIEHDQGVFRSLLFKQGKSMNAYFRITTWPGHLCYSGDMGTYVFSRNFDMVDFFEERVNPFYWGQKLQSVSRFGEGYEVFDCDAFIKHYKNYVAEHHDSDKDTLECLSWVSNEQEAADFVWGKLDDDEPYFPTKLTYHYLYACHAIYWACNHYKTETKKLKVNHDSG